MTTNALTEALKAAIDAAIEFEALKTEIIHSRNGWAAYKGGRRITRYLFSAEGAQEAATAREASDVKVQF